MKRATVLLVLVLLITLPIVYGYEFPPNGEYTVTEEDGRYTATYPNFSLSFTAPENMIVTHKDTEPTEELLQSIGANRKWFDKWKKEEVGPDGYDCYQMYTKDSKNKEAFFISAIAGYPGIQVTQGDLMEHNDPEGLIEFLFGEEQDPSIMRQEIYRHPQILFWLTEYQAMADDENLYWFCLETAYNNRWVRFGVASKQPITEK